MRKSILVAAAGLAVIALVVLGWGSSGQRSDNGYAFRGRPAKVNLNAPANGDEVGVQGGKGWIVDLSVEFPVPLEQTGVVLQLTGPGAHDNIAPFPGTFSPGRDDDFPGLIVLLSNTPGKPGDAGFQGPGTNLANLFNVTGVGNIEGDSTEVNTTWIVGAPNWLRKTTIYVAIAADLNKDGIYNDAPSLIVDSDGDGRIDEFDLRAFGVASRVVEHRFFVNP